VNDALLIWSVPLVIALHNLEEALWLPAWSQKRIARWQRPVDAGPFRFAVSALTLVAFLLAGWTELRGPGSWGHYLLAAYALGQGLNVLFPHAIATVLSRTYAPGLLSGLFFVLPATATFLVRSFAGGELHAARFVKVSLLVIPLMLLSIPVLFAIGRKSIRRLHRFRRFGFLCNLRNLWIL
jgi:hypothetical protein